MTFRLHVSPMAEADIDDILLRSITQFGREVSEGYSALLKQAFHDIADDPTLVGSHDRPELGPLVRSLHLRASRDHIPDGFRRIVTPVHHVFYRVFSGTVQVSRVLHESQNFIEHAYP